MKKEDRVYPNDDPDEAARKYHEANEGSIIPLLEVSEALRTKIKHFQVVGQIATISTIHSMVSAVNLKCLSCNSEWTVSYEKNPRLNIPSGSSFSCLTCSENKKEDPNVVVVSPEWIPALDIQLQDTQKFNSIERLNVKLFGDNTRDVIAGEPVIIEGYGDKMKKNESNNSGKYIPVLYAEFVEYTKKEEVKLTQQDINLIDAWKKEKTKEGKNILDLLVEKFCPTIIGHEFVKKSLLIAAANAGIKNDKKRFPRRLRSHVLVVRSRTS